MGLFDFFFGKNPEAHEQLGDEHIGAGAVGDALLEYEKAIDRIEKRFPEKIHIKDRLVEKMQTARNGLARNHLENAQIMATAGDLSDAYELYELALELAEDKALKREIEGRLSDFTAVDAPPIKQEAVFQDAVSVPDDAVGVDEDLEEIFSVLLNALPEELQEAYSSYGDSFMAGYVALNEGDFEFAVAQLENAMDENRPPNLIPMELSTALIHLGRHDEAADHLEAFVSQNPEQPRAYQLLCEIYWDRKEYDQADRLLSQTPEGIKNSKSMLILQGENRFRKKEYADAESVFETYKNLYGRDEMVSRALAKTLEASGRPDAARELYAEIINKCHSCGTRADPFLKRKYAELCYQGGEASTNLLNIYLGLAREDPDNRAVYFSRASGILKSMGEFDEAKRYAALAQNAEP